MKELWRRKQKHIDAHYIKDAFISYPKIPTTFDGALPLSKKAEQNRILVGETYFFDDVGENGIVGKVTTAMISEPDRKMYFGISTKDNQNQILCRDVTEEELVAYKAHPDGFFGVVDKAPKKVKDKYELFEWFVDCYMETPKEKLLKLAKDHPNFASIKTLGHEELVLELCESWVSLANATEQERENGAN